LQGDSTSLYKALRKTQPVEFGALLNFTQSKIVSLSPELFIHKKKDVLTSKPMKGTAKRGATKKEDQEIVRFLKEDSKTLSENVMIVDLIRNDVSKVCKIGSVHVNNLFQVQTFKSIHQMISTVEGQLKPDVSLHQLLNALFPSGSITGAPKIRAMQIINDIETEPRGVYTGAIGYVLPDDNFCFNVPIRTILINDKDKHSNNDMHCEMGIGSGIVHQSDAHEEFRECLLKANFLKHINAHFYLIETLRLETTTEIYHHIDQHIARLLASATIFGFTLDLQTIKNKLNRYKIELCQQKNPCRYFKIRLTAYQNGNINIQHDALLEDKQNQLRRIMLSPFKIKSYSIFQHHKTSHREQYNKAYQLAEQQGYYDVVFFNENNELAEASRHNIFIQKKGHYLTPPLSAGILNGIERAQFIQQHHVEEKKLSRTDLINADKILLSNSVRGIVTVELDACDS
jgi:para-aminobenzoate synthetase/4-amino-4-deoxychorismate lyase